MTRKEVDMWTTAKRAAFVAALFVGVSAGSARADELKVRVPFSFVAGGQTLPAGEYVIKPVNEEDPAVVMIRGTGNTKSEAIVLTMPVEGKDPGGDKPVLTFTHNGSQYRLSTIWEPDGEGRTLSHS
jgi:hypothetical protein